MEEICEMQDEAKSLTKESRYTSKIVKGNGVMGWLHTKILKDTEKYKKRNKEISKEIKILVKKSKKVAREMKDKKNCPHISSSKLKMYATVKVE